MWDVWVEVASLLSSATVAVQTVPFFASYEWYGCEWCSVSTAHHFMSSRCITFLPCRSVLHLKTGSSLCITNLRWNFYLSLWA
jgi:hypothetical protein